MRSALASARTCGKMHALRPSFRLHIEICQLYDSSGNSFRYCDMLFGFSINLTLEAKAQMTTDQLDYFSAAMIFFKVGGRKRLRIPFFKDSKLLSPTYIKADIFTLMIAYSGWQQGRKMMQDQFLIPATLKLCPNTTLGLGSIH